MESRKVEWQTAQMEAWRHGWMAVGSGRAALGQPTLLRTATDSIKKNDTLPLAGLFILIFARSFFDFARSFFDF